MEYPAFLARHPRLSGWLSFFALTEGLWGLAYGDPLIPTAAKVIGLRFEMITWLSPIFPFLLAVVGFVMLLAILINTSKGNKSQAAEHAKIVIGPEVKFGSPQQDAGEMNVSWWHIPIWLSADEKPTVTRYEDCKVRLIFIGSVIYPGSVVDLVCRKVDNPKGVSEFSLVLGDDPRSIPIAIRWESDFASFYSRGDTFITGVAHQFQSVRTKLKPGEYRFKLEVRCGTEKWESGIYSLRVPETSASNGQFILSKVD